MRLRPKLALRHGKPLLLTVAAAAAAAAAVTVAAVVVVQLLVAHSLLWQMLIQMLPSAVPL
jgi:hypothetical protein